MRKRALFTMSCLLVVAAAVAQNISLKAPKLLPWSQQMAVREQWLEKRPQMILPMMRRFGSTCGSWSTKSFTTIR